MTNHCHRFKVRTYCATYNHESYILDALNGFVMQQTTFPVVYTIVDDASTDKTLEVLREFVDACFDLHETNLAYEKDTEYGHVTFARHKTNKNCYFAIIYLNENHYSQKKSKASYLTEWMDTKYVAFCEGDDYWTDPMKLQKQVDFLENNAEYVACFCRCSIFYESENRMTDKDQFDGIIQKGQKGLDLAGSVGVLPQLLTMVYRKEVLGRSEWYYKLNLRSQYDQTMIFAIGELGKIWVLNDNMGVYRRHKGGVATSLSKKQAAEKMYLTWHDVFEVHPNEETKAMYSNSLKQYMYFLIKNGRNRSELKTLNKEYKCLKEPWKQRVGFWGRLVKGLVIRSVKLTD